MPKKTSKKKVVDELVEETTTESNELVLGLQGSLRRAQQQIEKLKAKKEELSFVLRQAVADSINAMALPSKTKAPKVDKRSKNEEVAVAILSDFQTGKATPNYNSSICAERIKYLAEVQTRIITERRNGRPIRKLHVWMLGDMVEGELIFPANPHQIDSSLYRQLFKAQEIIFTYLQTMLTVVDEIHVCGVPGNHGNLSKYNHPETNMDLILYEMTKRIFDAMGEKRITWDIPFLEGERAWYVVDTIGEYSCFLFHGDQIRGSAAFPWYGFFKKVLGWNTLGQSEHFPIKKFKDCYAGHWHTPTKFYLNGITVRVSGSTESYNVYAQEKMSAMGEPSQPFMFVHPIRGIVTAEYEIKLQGSMKLAKSLEEQ